MTIYQSISGSVGPLDRVALATLTGSEAKVGEDEGSAALLSPSLTALSLFLGFSILILESG